MAKSQAQQSKSKYYRIITIAVVVILALCAWAVQRRQHLGSVHTPNDTPVVDASQIYESVVIPDDIPQQIISYPGFTVSFNSEHHQPNYVVWELTGQEAKSRKVSRSNNFTPDYRVDGCPDNSDYISSGYDRGHMAPAGDMKWDKDAMDACFYFTNMSPQNRDLNSGAWNSLEEACRGWAVRDSAIVIVCGPILTDEITRTIGPNGVSVPERYFKVVLSPYSRPPRAIGFIMENRRITGGLATTAVSVDEVEAATGFDFFSALDDDVEDKIESECNYSKWTRR